MPVWAQIEAPKQARQGEVVRVRAAGATTVTFDDRTFPFFAGEALVPVSALKKPGKYTLQVGTQTLPFEVVDAQFPIQNIRATKGMKELKPLPGEMEAIRALHQMVTPQRLWAEPFGEPTPDCMNSRFGVQRYHNDKPTGNYHRGVDLRSPLGRPVRAIADGVVKLSRMYRLHGGTIGVDHGQGVTSTFIHLSKLAGKEGQTVKKGDVVGYVGATGFATGPHLHWGLYVHGVPVDPALWVRSEACTPR